MTDPRDCSVSATLFSTSPKRLARVFDLLKSTSFKETMPH
jgi:hypothetical protein